MVLSPPRRGLVGGEVQSLRSLPLRILSLTWATRFLGSLQAEPWAWEVGPCPRCRCRCSCGRTGWPEWLAQTLTWLARQDGSISSIFDEKLVMIEVTSLKAVRKVRVLRARRCLSVSSSGAGLVRDVLGTCPRSDCPALGRRSVRASDLGDWASGRRVPGQLLRVPPAFPLPAPRDWPASGATARSFSSPSEGQGLLFSAVKASLFSVCSLVGTVSFRFTFASVHPTS